MRYAVMASRTCQMQFELGSSYRLAIHFPNSFQSCKEIRFCCLLTLNSCQAWDELTKKDRQVFFSNRIDNKYFVYAWFCLFWNKLRGMFVAKKMINMHPSSKGDTCRSLIEVDAKVNKKFKPGQFSNFFVIISYILFYLFIY